MWVQLDRKALPEMSELLEHKVQQDCKELLVM